jgi:hypothetical protein
MNNKDILTEKIIEEPMGDDDIKKYLPTAKILKYSQLSNYKTIDKLLPKNKDYCFLLYEDSLNKGHWVALLKYNNNIEYFDSYGGKVDNPLNWTSKEKRKELKQNKKMLSQLLDNCKYNVIYNPIDYQEDNEHKNVNTCGRHTTFRVKNLTDCERNLKEYYELMKHIKNNSGNTYDEIVSHLIDNL